MLIEIKETEYGLYLSTIYKGCKYGQGYKDKDKDKARQDFRRIVHLIANGQTWRVMSGVY